MNASDMPNTETASGPERRVSAGQLGMWIFISTEFMLFAALIGSFLIFRLSAIGTGWPSPSDMHVSMLAGIINTLLLVFSGLSAWAMYNAARDGKPMTARLWLILTITLGLAFLGIKGWEYYQKYRVGLMPVPGQQQIYSQADYKYVSAVKQRLKNDIGNLERRADSDNPLSAEEQNRLLMLYDLKEHMAEFTARVAGTSDDSWYATLSMNLMAHQIMRHDDTSRRIEEILEPEMRELERRLARDAERLELVEARRRLVKEQVIKMEKEIQQMQLLNPDGSDDQQSLEEKQQWLDAKNRQATELEVEQKRILANIRPLIGRICHILNDIQPLDDSGEYFRTDKPEVLSNRLKEAAREAETEVVSADEDIGLNEKYDLQLPVVITNGQQWMSMYLLLTGVHALHVIAGLLVFLWYLPRKLTVKRSPALYVACMYWQFVDFVWLLIFWLIYF